VSSVVCRRCGQVVVPVGDVVVEVEELSILAASDVEHSDFNFNFGIFVMAFVGRHSGGGGSLDRAVLLGIALGMGEGVVRLVSVCVSLMGSVCGSEWGWTGGTLATIMI